MILELDCGNSFIKWRVLNNAALGVFAEGVVDSDDALVGHLRALSGLALTRCRLVSVRTVEETNKLTSMLVQAFGVSVVCAAPAKEMAGVRNGYEEFERLGLDRWLAMLGAFAWQLVLVWCSILGRLLLRTSLRRMGSTWGVYLSGDAIDA